jgi:UDP:flavonoid glycosyltransferase YjiC (YdhE family)
LRIFLGAFGQPGHAFPMLALGERLVQRGHQVTYETWRNWRSEVEATGMEFVAAPEYPVFPTQEEPLKPYQAVLRATSTTREAIAACGPDVVVHDILTLAPALGGELEGVPVATLIPHIYPVGAPGFPPYAFGARLPRTIVGRAAWRSLQRPIETGLRMGQRELNDTRQRLGLPPVERLYGGISEKLTLVATFPGLEYPRAWPDGVHVIGPLMWEPRADPVAVPPGDEPLVVVAPSTAQDPTGRMLHAAVSGLADADLRVLATTNHRMPGRPLTVGRKQALVDWMSYAETMPQADLVICHAGHGTLVRALSCGVPVVAVPHVGDMAENAARLDWSGAGVRLPWRMLSPLTLRLAVKRALDAGAAYAEHAAEFGAWADAHDAAPTAAELIEGLAAG